MCAGSPIAGTSFSFPWPPDKEFETDTRRTHGHSLAVIIADVNRTLQGWFQYFQHSHDTTFAPLDKWVRMRLRSILRKRHGRRGRGRGADHQRWPNAFFTAQGLFSLTTAQALARQSVTTVNH